MSEQDDSYLDMPAPVATGLRRSPSFTVYGPRPLPNWDADNDSEQDDSLLGLHDEITELRTQVKQLTAQVVAERALSNALRQQVDHLNSLAAIMSDPIFEEPQP
jgi:hypothetical protein